MKNIVAKEDPEYVLIRNAQIPAATKFADDVCGSSFATGREFKSNAHWAFFWNKNFNLKMDELTKKALLSSSDRD
jgi:hypothetical protein